MTNSETPRVVFFQVSDPAAKIAHIAQTAQYHFLRKERFLVLAEEDKALAYVDELLWNHTPEIFLPHAIHDAECQEWIALTKLKKNLNDARYVFNLCPTPLLIEGPFRIIYDFEDTSSQSKKNLSATRYDSYKQAHFLIESRGAASDS
ncbi:MAG: polymerase chi subunit [Parachlamydiales bacterium]|nr:polymerase chi subunit [Parachlamydiales bacterium]